MADVSASNWNAADASNTDAAPDGAPEGMAPSGVNNVLRAHQGAIKRWYDWTIPKATAGTSTAYTLSYSVAPGALVDGMTHMVQFNAANGDAPTLNINILGAIPLHYYSAGAWGGIPAGLIGANEIYRVAYNSSAGAYRLLGRFNSGGTTFLAADVPLNNISNFFDGPNTGSIGAAGEKWLVTATGAYVDAAAAATFVLAIFDGSAYINSTPNTTGSATYFGSHTVSAVVTLAGATTFTLRARDVSTTSGTLLTTGSFSAINNRATSITAVRI